MTTAPAATLTGMLLVTAASTATGAPARKLTLAPPLPDRLSWEAINCVAPLLMLMFCPPPASSVIGRSVGPGMLLSTVIAPLVVENSIGLVLEGVRLY